MRPPSLVLRNGSYALLLSSLLIRSAHAQASNRSSTTAEDTARAVSRLDQMLVRSAALLQREVWPGYHYDSLGMMFMIPDVAKVAVRPSGEVPTGMRALEGVANTWWADTQYVSWNSFLPVVNVSSRMTRGQLLALAMHEAFHAYQRRAARAGRQFGRGENSLLTAQYPLFDLQNEAWSAVEGELLAAALHASKEAEARALAAQFIAVRTRRYASLDSAFVEFERHAELHEGLAQYVYLRGLAVLSQSDASLRADAQKALDAETAVLRGGSDAAQRSVRRRFYATGSLLGLLLDRLAPTAWKQRVVNDDMWLDRLLAERVGAVPMTTTTEQRINDAMAVAVKRIAVLGVQRTRLEDSIVQARGTYLVLQSMEPLDWCGFDPQNVLTTVQNHRIHMRMISLCHGGNQIARFTQPVIEDPFARSWHTVVEGSIRVLSSGSEVALPEPGISKIVDDAEVSANNVTLKAQRIILIRGIDRLVVVPQ